MTFDRTKILAEGGTYHGAENPLIECAPFTATAVSFAPVSSTGEAPAAIKESADLPKRMVIEGVFQRAGVRNANQRVYPRSLFERMLAPDSPVQKRIAERAMIGHLEHPESGTTDLNKGAIRIDKVWMEGDGTVKGRAIVFNTPEGQRIQEYVATGTKIGISSRGTGTVDAKGNVCEDFALETWDMVYNPSTPGANPTAANESADEQADRRTPVVEDANRAGTIPPQDKTMNIAERFAAVKEQADRLLAIDPKRLSEAARAKHAAELLNTRIAVAEEFSGEKRMVAEALLKQIDDARKVAESTDSETTAGFTDAPVGGQTDGAGVPGNGFDILNKAIAASGTARQKAAEAVDSIAKLIAANISKVHQFQPALEAVVADKTDAAVTESALTEEVRGLLAEARDEILTLSEREEAASAIIAEMTARLAAAADAAAAHAKVVEGFQSEIASFKAAAEKSAEVIADLTAAKAKQVAESTKKVDEAPKRKSLAERLRKDTTTEGAEALPTPGQVAESSKDAGVVEHAEAPNASKKVFESAGASIAARALAALAKDNG